MFNSTAIDQALSAYRNPALAPRARSNHVPKDILELIKIAAGDEDALNLALSRQAAASRETIVAAAKLYLQKELTAAGTDCSKILLLKPGADAQTLKDHKRWLLKWLHPDRNKNAWENKLFQKVQAAAKELETNGITQSSSKASVSVKKPKARKAPKRFIVPLEKKRSVPRLIVKAVANPISLSAVLGAALFWLIVRYAGEADLSAFLVGR